MRIAVEQCTHGVIYQLPLGFTSDSQWINFTQNNPSYGPTTEKREEREDCYDLLDGNRQNLLYSRKGHIVVGHRDAYQGDHNVTSHLAPHIQTWVVFKVEYLNESSSYHQR